MNRAAVVSAAMLAAVSSCIPAPPPTVTASPSAAAATMTATVAFPTVIPSATWTPGASLTPTVDLRADSGPVLLHDSMDDPAVWRLTTTDTGVSAITDGRLTLSVRTPRAYHTAHRIEPVVGDFYAEIDVVTEVCHPGDEVGMTARGGGLFEQYRFLIGCDGTARITRILEEDSRALTLRVSDPAILGGAPARNRLGIWLSGLDLKFLVNGEEVLAVRDAALSRGTLGVIARAGSGGQVSAAFDDLIIYALLDPRFTPSPSATRVPPLP